MAVKTKTTKKPIEVPVEAKAACKDAVEETHKPLKRSLARKRFLRKKRKNARINKK